VWLDGFLLNSTLKKEISSIYLCNDSITGCPWMNSLPTLSHRPSANTTQYWWNWSSKVNQYYPTGYIEDDMWDLTARDYDDTPFSKAAPGHYGKIIMKHKFAYFAYLLLVMRLQF
jgi:hypothetical protein